MRMTSFFRGSTVAALFAALLAASTALADKDGKDRGGGDRGGGDHSSRSFSGGSDRSSRSFSGGDKSSRSIISGSSKSSSGSGQSTIRSFQGRSNNDQSRDSFRTGQSGDRSTQFKSNQSGGKQSFDSKNSQFNQGTRNYQVQRPNEDQVRDFLKLRENDASRQSDKDGAKGNFKGPGSDGNRQSFFRGGGNDKFDKDKVGDNNRRGENDRNRDSNDRNFRDRDAKDRDFVNQQYKKWRDIDDGKHKDGHDNRDWSGHWKDSDRFDVADHIRHDWRDRHDNDFPFRGDWWKHHRHGNDFVFWDDFAHRHNRPYFWWTWTTGPRLSSWVTFGWPTPYYWDYGPGEYISYDNGAIYVNGRWYQPAPVFYDQTVRLIDQAPDLTPEQAAQLEWLPLGVFAVTRDGVAEPDVLVQLAVTKDGIIGGNAFDQRTGAAYPIEGIVDKRSQRAVWNYVNDRNKRVVMETSIYNLTQGESTGLVHNSPNDIQVIELVRLEEPDSSGRSTTDLPAPPVAQ